MHLTVKYVFARVQQLLRSSSEMLLLLEPYRTRFPSEG